MTAIDLPATARFQEYEIQIITTAPLQRGAYNLADHTLDFGGEMWRATYRIVAPTLAEAAEWQGILDEVREVGNYLRLYTPNGTRAQFGTMQDAAGALVGAHSAGARNVTLDGLTNGTTIGRGTYFDIDDDMYRVRKDAVVNGSGQAAIEVTPRLRQALANDATVQFDNARSRWKLAGDPPGFIRDNPTRYNSVALDLQEAISR